MTMQLNREAGGDQDLVLHYWKADSRAIRMVLPLLFAVFTFFPLWLLFLAVNQILVFMGLGLTGPPFEDPSATWPPVVGVGLLMAVGVWLFGWLTVRVGLASYRSVRGSWWLRLSPTGFAVNYRLGRATALPVARDRQVHAGRTVGRDPRCGAGPGADGGRGHQGRRDRGVLSLSLAFTAFRPDAVGRF